MRDTRAMRVALIIGITAATSAIIAELFVRPNIEKGMR